MESNDVNIKFLIDLRQNIEREIETLKNIVSEKEEQLEYITTIVKKDCDHIGYTFSMYIAGEIDTNEMIVSVSSLDDRIKEEFEFWGDCRERDEAIVIRFNDLMTKKLGHDWSLMETSKEISKEVYEQAVLEIGDT